jgi:RNA polymerase sigma factor (TIGR02999 family)
MPNERPKITALLTEWRCGNEASRDALIEVVYPELRKLAAYHLRGEKANHTLQPTALVNDLYVRVLAKEPLLCHDRTHFFAIVGRQLRRILIDHARASRAAKRGGLGEKVTLTAVVQQIGPVGDDILSLDEALTRLEDVDARAAQVVELKFFGGLGEREAAEFLHISVATLKRDWEFARAWLSAQMSSPTPAKAIRTSGT